MKVGMVKPPHIKMPHIGHPAASVKSHTPSAPKIHPAANLHDRVKLPDAESIGADPAPLEPGVGKF